MQSPCISSTVMHSDVDEERINKDGSVHPLLKPISLPFALPTSLYGAMLAIWHLRPILQRRFPLHKGRAKDYLRFLAWCAVHGRREYVILRSIPQWDGELAKPISLPALSKDRWANGYSVAMFLFGISRYRYTFGGMLNSVVARHRVARAYFRGERHRCKQTELLPWHSEYIKSSYSDISCFLDALVLRKKDSGKSKEQLIDEFGLQDLLQHFEDGGSEFGCVTDVEATILAPIRSRMPFRLPIRLIRYYTRIAEKIRSLPNEFEQSSITSHISISNGHVEHGDYPFGVNLFGYAKGELGIGEDVRLLALALQEQNIPFGIINVAPGSNVSQKDDSVEQWIVDKPQYAINIFCTTGIEHVRYVCEHGLDVCHGRYTIGLWPWELPDWPASCNYAYSVVDEIWGISQFTANAYRFSSKPVYTMTLPVVVESIAPMDRADFGLPDDPYLFVFAFDFNSTLTRKNPLALIQAFQRAFPSSADDKVGLVLKASHVSKDNKYWPELAKIIKGDSRVHFIGDTFRRPQLLALYKSCDCYVSLHRAEGFGRTLAEALLLDMQLIATDYSGNLDFCKSDRVALVRSSKKYLEVNDYFHAEGQYWAEPDIEHAAVLLREVAAKPLPTTSGVDFSPASVGRRYAHRLYQLKEQLQLKGKGDLIC